VNQLLEVESTLVEWNHYPQFLIVEFELWLPSLVEAAARIVRHYEPKWTTFESLEYN